MTIKPRSDDKFIGAVPRLRVRLALAGAAVVLATFVSGCGGGATGAQSQPPAVSSPSQNTRTAPPGLPSNWQKLAIEAANTALKACAQANSLDPTNCPQRINSVGFDTLAVRWTLLNGNLSHAVAVFSTEPGSGAIRGATGQVAVYGLYQMNVSYTTRGQAIRPYQDYSGGVAGATMTWDGSSFQNVQFKPVSATQLPADVSVAPFTRPTRVSDAAVLDAVRAGFQDCVTLKMPVSAVLLTATSPPVANCPQSSRGVDVFTVSAQWVLTSDPMQGALVSFDTKRGDFVVTGSFDMDMNTVVTKPDNPFYGPSGPHTARSTGHYTASLAWDGQELKLVNIANT
jgi:hypothetical protein